MSGLLERIARRRRALEEHRLQRLPETEGAQLPIGPDGSAGSIASVNGSSTNGADSIGHFVDGLDVPSGIQDAHDDQSEAPMADTSSRSFSLKGSFS